LNRTPIHLSACHGHVDICRKLIAGGTEKNAQDEDENTALHLASEFGQA
jgi:ankyrin repeat protein